MTEKNIRNPQIAEEAADWAVALDAGDLSFEQKRRLADWLLESPRHVEELLINASLYDALEGVDPAKSRTIDELISSLPSEVVSIVRDQPFESVGAELSQLDQASDNTPITEEPKFASRWGRWFGVGAAASLALVIAAVALLPRIGGENDPTTIAQDASDGFATALGEQRKMTLADGSIVHVNTQSEIAIRYEENERIVELVRGEALFDVAHDSDRPFRVIAGDTIAEAIGTTFNVYRTDAGASVAVIDGKVAVTAPGEVLEMDNAAGIVARPVERTDDGRVLLEAGQKAEVAIDANTVRVAAANVKAVSAWSVGQLIFEGESLGAIANQFNRYNRVRIVVDDSALAATELSGVFDADDPESLIETLEVMGGVTADRSDRNVIRLRAL